MYMFGKVDIRQEYRRGKQGHKSGRREWMCQQEMRRNIKGHKMDKRGGSKGGV